MTLKDKIELQLKTDPRLRIAVAAQARARGISPAQAIQELVAARAQRDILGAAYSAEMQVADPVTHLTDDGVQRHVVDRLRDPGDFESMIEERNEALLANGGDEFAAEATLLEKYRNDYAARSVITTPASAVKSVLGSQATVKSGGDPVTVAYFVGDDTETGAITVTFGAVRPVTPALVGIGVSQKPVGIVAWGTRSFQQQVEVDIGVGTQLVVSGSACTVSVKLDPVVEAFTNPGTMTLSGMLSFHEVVRSYTPITRTVYMDNISAGGNTRVVVPAFAKSFTLQRTNSTSATLQLQNANGDVMTTVFVAGFQDTPIVLPGDIFFIGVVDTAGGGMSNPRLIFNLEL